MYFSYRTTLFPFPLLVSVIPSVAPFPYAALCPIPVCVAKCDPQVANFKVVKFPCDKCAFIFSTGEHDLKLELVIRLELLCAGSKKIMILNSIPLVVPTFVAPSPSGISAPIILIITNYSRIQDFCATGISFIFSAGFEFY